MSMRACRDRVRAFIYSAIYVALIAAPQAGQQTEPLSARAPANPVASAATPAPPPNRPADDVATPVDDPASVEPAPTTRPAPVTVPPQRPAALIPLYTSFVALQALDVHSTLWALDHGGVEGNPLVQPFVGSHGFALVKIATTTAMILAVERLRKTHPRAAVIVMIAANSGYAMIVANNYALSRRD
jgi:hypothetical protein